MTFYTAEYESERANQQDCVVEVSPAGAERKVGSLLLIGPQDF